MSAPDRLHRTITVGASRELVWDALTTPEQLVRWFPTHDARIDLRPGGAARFAWKDTADEAVIEVVEPPERLVFRWRPEGTDRPHTRVSITLADADGGTTLTLEESGFASLPDQIEQQSYDGNAEGWAAELAELAAYLEAS